jgi:hypothetical protein
VISVWCVEATWAALRWPPLLYVVTEQFSSGDKAGHRFGRYPDTYIELCGFRSLFVGVLGQHLDFSLIALSRFRIVISLT